MTNPVTESIKVIRGIMEFIRVHGAHPGGFDPELAERRVNARLKQIEDAFAATAHEPVAVVGQGNGGGGVGVTYLPALYSLPHGTKLYAAPGASIAAREQEGEVPPPSAAERGLTYAERRMLSFLFSQMSDLSDTEWRQHDFRRATFDRLQSKCLAVMAYASREEAPATPAAAIPAAPSDENTLVELAKNHGAYTHEENNPGIAIVFRPHQLVAFVAAITQPTTVQQAEPPSEKQQKLLDLADRIDHEELWRRAGLFRKGMTPEQCDRLDAGVALRRYADLWAPGRWVVFPPVGPVHFSASTLETAVEMALKRN